MFSTSRVEQRHDFSNVDFSLKNIIRIVDYYFSSGWDNANSERDCMICSIACFKIFLLLISHIISYVFVFPFDCIWTRRSWDLSLILSLSRTFAIWFELWLATFHNIDTRVQLFPRHYTPLTTINSHIFTAPKSPFLWVKILKKNFQCIKFLGKKEEEKKTHLSLFIFFHF